MISFEVIPHCFSIRQRIADPRDHFAKRHAAPGVPLRIEENLDMPNMVVMRALEIGPGQVIEILAGQQHGHTLIIDIKEVLQIAEIICLPNIVNAGEGDIDPVALRQRKQHLGLERSFYMQVELGLGQAIDIGGALVGCHDTGYANWVAQVQLPTRLFRHPRECGGPASLAHMVPKRDSRVRGNDERG